MINTPKYVYKKIKVKKDPSQAKQTNFKIFGLTEENMGEKKITNADGSVFLVDSDFSIEEESKGDHSRDRHYEQYRKDQLDVNRYISFGTVDPTS